MTQVSGMAKETALYPHAVLFIAPHPHTLHETISHAAAMSSGEGEAARIAPGAV